MSINKTSYISDAEKVYDFNFLFDTPNIDIHHYSLINNELNFKNNFDTGLKLINEEFNEFKEAYENNDIIEIKDALCDMIYVIYGLFYRFKIHNNDEIYKYTLGYNKDLDNNHFNDIYKLSEYYNDITWHKLFSQQDNYETINTFKSYVKLNLDFKQQIDLFNINDNISLNVEQFNKNYNEFKNINIKNKYLADYHYVYNHYKNQMLYNLGNLLLQVYISGMFLFDMQTSFAIVHNSNMTKFCLHEEEAIQSVNKYKLDFENGNTKYDTPTYFSKETNNNTIWIIKNSSDGKVLKNINYKSVDKFDNWYDDIEIYKKKTE